MLRTISALLLALCMHSEHAADITTAWKTILKKCAKSNLIGRQQAFLGLSNSVGPGSVWRFADDKSLRLLFELSDAVSDEEERKKIVREGPLVTCTGDSRSDWSVRLGIPFIAGQTPVIGDLAAVLGRASRITVSVTGYSIDVLKETP